jgi:hypothetical protein
MIPLVKVMMKMILVLGLSNSVWVDLEMDLL